MKKLLIVVIACISISLSAAYAQDSVIAGENYLTGETIKVKEFSFPNRIYYWRVVDSTSRVIVQLREINWRRTRWKEDGKLVCFDLKERKNLWSQRISYVEPVVQRGNLLFFCNDRWERKCCDINTGALKCSPEQRLFYLSPTDDIGMGFDPDNLRKAQGVDLNTGNVLWERRIRMQYGVNGICPLNDSMLLLSCSGLHALNLRDGTGWDFEAKTGLKDFTAAAAGSAVGIALGAFTGVYTIICGYDVLTGLCSNTLMDADRIYFADMNRLSCLGKDGRVIWQKEFDDELLSKSFLFTKGSDTLILLNLGYGYFGKRTVSYGRPFIAAYDRNTGTQLYALRIGGEDYPVKKFLVEESSIILLLEDKIAKCPLVKGGDILQQRFADIDVDYLKEFIRKDAYMQYGGTFIPLKEAYPGGLAVQGSCRVFILGDDLEIIDSIEEERIYRPITTVGSYKFMLNQTEIAVADSEGNEVARIGASGSCFRNGNFLYVVRDNTIIEIDLHFFLQGD